MQIIQVEGNIITINCSFGERAGSPHEAIGDHIDKNTVYIHEEKPEIVCGGEGFRIEGIEKYNKIPIDSVRAISRAIYTSNIRFNDYEVPEMRCEECGKDIDIISIDSVMVNFDSGEIVCCEEMPYIGMRRYGAFMPNMWFPIVRVSMDDIVDHAYKIKEMMSRDPIFVRP